MRLPLRLGPLGGDGHSVHRSGITWLCEDGHLCRAREVVAFCNLTVEASGLRQLGAPPFAGERALQVALAPRVAGRLRIDADAASTAHLNVFRVHPWDSRQVIAHLEPAEDSGRADQHADPGEMDLLMLAGRRMAWALDVPAGLLPGWHSRARGWWSDGGAPGPTLISLGFCDATSVVRGDSAGFVEMFEAAPFAALRAVPARRLPADAGRSTGDRRRSDAGPEPRRSGPDAGRLDLRRSPAHSVEPVAAA